MYKFTDAQLASIQRQKNNEQQPPLEPVAEEEPVMVCDKLEEEEQVMVCDELEEYHDDPEYVVLMKRLEDAERRLQATLRHLRNP